MLIGKNHFHSASWEVIILLTGKSIKDGVCNTPLHHPETANPPILMSRKPPVTPGMAAITTTPILLSSGPRAMSANLQGQREQNGVTDTSYQFFFNKDKWGPA